MTTIAWRDGVLAADSRATGDGGILNVRKMFNLPDGRVIACCGELSSAMEFVEAIRKGTVEKFRAKGSFDAMVMLPSGSLVIYEKGRVAIPVQEKFYAMGSGGMVALGAMAMGASAEQAVKIAARYDCYTGGKVLAVKAKGKRK